MGRQWWTPSEEGRDCFGELPTIQVSFVGVVERPVKTSIFCVFSPGGCSQSSELDGMYSPKVRNI